MNNHTDDIQYDDLVYIDPNDQEKIKNVDIHIHIGKIPVGQFLYTWNDAKDKVSLEEISYLKWSAKIFAKKGAMGELLIPVIRYNVLLRVAKRYPDDDMEGMLKTIQGKNGYRDVTYRGKVY